MNRTPSLLLFVFVIFAVGIGPVAAMPSDRSTQVLQQRLHAYPQIVHALSDAAGVLEQSSAVPADSRRQITVGDQSLVIRHNRALLEDAATGGELFLLESARDAAAVRLGIEEISGFAEVVNDGRGVRFISAGGGPDVQLAAPLIIDASGRPSWDARWVIARDGSGAPTSLRLVTGDRQLRYPIAAVSGWNSAVRTPLRPALHGTGAVSGTVTNAAGAPIPGAAVFLYDSLGQFMSFGFAEADGTYSITELEAGSYRATASADGFASELYNNFPCPDLACNVGNGTAINVVDEATTTGINFSLATTGTAVGGRVRDTAGNPLAGVIVVAYDSNLTPSGSATSDANGTYRIDASPGTYRLRTFNSLYPGFSEQIYSGINCNACNVASGTPVNLTSGTVLTNIDFNLSAAGGRIAGRVVDQAGGALVHRGVTIFSSNGTSVSYALTDDNGDYISFHGLLPGTYFVLASAFGYTAEVYDNVPCARCSVTTGTPVNVAAGATTQNIDFALSNAQAKVSGRVIDAATTEGIEGVIIVFYDALGRKVHSTTTEGAQGRYQATLSASGRYFVQTRNNRAAGYVDQLYSAIDCSGCDVKAGRAIDVVVGEHVTGVDFSLVKNGGSISGKILDAADGSPIPFGFVLVYGSSGEFATEGYADGTGTYTLSDGLTGGNFFVLARAFAYTAELYNDIGCPSECNVTAGTAVAVTRGSTTGNINFNLSSTSAKITGHVRSQTAALPGVDVFIYSAAGVLAATATSDSTGTYEAVVTSGGTYFAVTNNTAFPEFGDQLYNHITCNSCNPTTGSPIVVAAGGIASNINFDFGTSCFAILIEPTTLPDGRVGDAFNHTLTATGGTGTVTFALTDGSLPTGVTLNAGGTLTGTLTASGIYDFTITATDATSCTSSVVYQVIVSAASTTLTLTASATTATYGQPITFTATISPSTVPGDITFVDGAAPVTTAPLVAGTATRVFSTLVPGVHHISAAYAGSVDFAASTSNVVDVTIAKATPIITWNTPAPIVYGTALSSTQLNATTTVAGTFVYTPTAGTILDAGMHTLTTTFVPNDTSLYNNATKSVTLEVQKANQQVVWANPADIVFGTVLGPTQLNATVSVAGPSPAGALTYNPPAGTLLNAGTHTLSVTAAATSNYNEAQKSVTINVLRAVPTFSALTSPTIVVGTPTTGIGGVLSAGTLIPPGVVTITLNGFAQDAAIGADGSFSASFATASLQPRESGYAIQFAYAGSANFASASATSLLVVTYGVTGGPLQTNPANPGSTIPIRIRIANVSGANLSGEDISVTAYGVRLETSSTWLPVQPFGNTTDQFVYQRASGGSYMFNLKTTGLASGTYLLGIKVDNDPVIHTVTFEIR